MFQHVHLLLIITVTLVELLASLKPLTDTEQMCCPPSALTIGKNFIVLVNCKSSSTVILSLDNSAAESSLLQLTITRDDDTPLTTVAVQSSVWFTPLTNPSVDCDILIDA